MSETQGPKVGPFGSWHSTITPALLVEGAVGLADLSVFGGRVYWVESRPGEGGRQVIVSRDVEGGEPIDVIPSGFSVRTQVHEYGGRCYAITESSVIFSNWDDQRLWVIPDGGAPFPLTPPPEIPRGVRFADPVVTPNRGWMVCVRETHRDGGGVVNDLVAVPLRSSPEAAVPVVVASGRDFYSSPRLSPDGSQLAWISWNHPDMPWDSTVLSLAAFSVPPGQPPRLGYGRAVAGGPDVSVTQPRFSPSGELHYLSDKTGWWNIHDSTGANLCPLHAEFGEPDWEFGNSLYGFFDTGEIVATWSARGEQRIGTVHGDNASEVPFPFSQYESVTPSADNVFAIAGSPVLPPAVVRLHLPTAKYEVVRASRELPIGSGDISRPRHVEFPSAGGSQAHALFYEPRNSEWTAPEGERPPLIVMIHGGPTGSATSVFNLRVQFWTNRGFAVADVDYRGSAGYGRAYRNELRGQWGVADVEDCAAVVAWLDREGLVAGGRTVIRGGSAGGFTTLAALAFTDAFAGGASLYGVADLELLATETHKFESRYLDSMIGPWPETADKYRERSPIHHVDQITSPLILFQGLEDAVVPPEQSELMYEALRQRGVPVAYMAFEGEQHGFRKAETVITVIGAELDFYGRVLGFTPDSMGGTGGPLLDVANEDAISPRC